MKIVIAPDSFKESLSASQVAQSIARGILDVLPNAQLDLCPLADGGEGTIDAICSAKSGVLHFSDVVSPLGAVVRAKFAILASGQQVETLPGDIGFARAKLSADQELEVCESETKKIAVIEVAQACGLPLVKKSLRNPMRATSYGVGQIIVDALNAGASEIIIGLGGTATADGGAGALQALGVKFYDHAGELLGPAIGCEHLSMIDRIDISEVDKRVFETDIQLACDVVNPLIGVDGTARVYSKQKGATPEMIEQIELGMQNFADKIELLTGKKVANMPGSGAAGGIAAGFTGLIGAKIENGAHLIASRADLENRLHNADLCITGEGKLDSQTQMGKIPDWVAKLAKSQDIPTVCIAGQIAEDANTQCYRQTISLVSSLTNLETALTKTAELLREKGSDCIKDFIAS